MTENKPVIYKDHVVIPDDGRLGVLVPHAKRMMHEGKSYVLVPHKLDETKILNNLGYSVRPPIMTQYEFCGSTPFDAQRVTAAMVTVHSHCFILNGIGTGKTRAIVFGYDFMRREGKVKRMIVTSPLSTLRPTWARELMMIFPHLKFQVLHGSKEKRLKALATPADVYIINHDGVEVILDELVARTDIDMLVMDELTAYKEPRSDRWKATNKLARRMSRVVGMTGSPMTLSPCDAYGQMKIVNPLLVPESYTRFREKVMTKITNFKWIARSDAIETVFKKMQPSVRFSRDDCYDLPPCQTVTRQAELTPEQKKLYKEVAEECAASVAQGDIKAINEADRLNKLVQIALGVVYTTDKQVHELACGPRLAVLDEVVSQSESKVIVFTPYKHSLRMLAEKLRKDYTVAVVSGDVPNSERESIFHNFMQTKNPHIILAHPQCMSHGLTLTEASTIVWWGPPPSLETYEQANGRITRAGQRHAQLIVNIAATRMEERIYKRLADRADIQGLLLEMFESQELGELL